MRTTTAHRASQLFDRLLRTANRLRAATAPPPTTHVVRILLLHANGMGGTIRTVFNLAGYLARHRDVEIVSIVRTAPHPFFPPPPGVRITYLDDRIDPPKSLLRRWLADKPSTLIPADEAAYHAFTRYTDYKLLRFIRRMRTGVLISTRPGLSLAIAHLAPPGVITIAQEHVGIVCHTENIQQLINRRYRRLDALVTLTKADLREYRAMLRRRKPGMLVRIPNAVTPLPGPPSPLTGKTVIAVGRLTFGKGFHKLLAAWQRVAPLHPDWTLKIYGGGPQHERLARDIRERGLVGRAFLMGPSDDIGSALTEASIYALTSRHEGFPMVLLEAMSKGLAIVSYKIPHGPREMITNGVDGLLVKRRTAAAMARALRRVIEDDTLRHSLAEGARRTAARYDLDLVGADWDDFLARLLRRHQSNTFTK